MSNSKVVISSKGGRFIEVEEYYSKDRSEGCHVRIHRPDLSGKPFTAIDLYPDSGRALVAELLKYFPERRQKDRRVG